MRYLGLDLGAHRLGLATSINNIVMPLDIIKHDNNYDYLVNEIEKIVNSKKIDKIILGYPKNMNNSIGYKANSSIKFKEMLENKLNIEVVLEDERLSTVEATNSLINQDKKRKERKDIVDSLAACIILQRYIDRRENNER